MKIYDGNKKKNIIEKQQSQLLITQQLQTSSPLPPPEWLERYNTIYPSATEILFKDFEETSKHRREIEKEQLKIIKRGQIQGFITMLLLVICACIAAIKYRNPYLVTALLSCPILNYFIGIFNKKK